MIDEQALAKAAGAVSVQLWRVHSNPATVARAAITAYLAALPNDEAAFTAFDDALSDFGASCLTLERTSKSKWEQRVTEAHNRRNLVVELYRQAKGGA